MIDVIDGDKSKTMRKIEDQTRCPMEKVKQIERGGVCLGSPCLECHCCTVIFLLSQSLVQYCGTFQI